MDRYQRKLLRLTRAYRALSEEITKALTEYHHTGDKQARRAARHLVKQQNTVTRKMVRVNRQITARRLKGKST